MATFTTSSECARKAGRKTLTTATFPTTAKVDTMRDDAYGSMYKYHKGASDSNNVGHRIELRIVQHNIYDMVGNKKYDRGKAMLTKTDKYDLENAFNLIVADNSMTFIPNEGGT